MPKFKDSGNDLDLQFLTVWIELSKLRTAVRGPEPPAAAPPFPRRSKRDGGAHRSRMLPHRKRDKARRR